MNHPKVTAYIEARTQFQDCLLFLRDLFQKTELVEDCKWGMPVYTIDNKNVVGIHVLKTEIGLWFYQGVFLKDRAKKLINAQEGTTKAMRHWRFSEIAEIKKDKALIIKYIEEAIENQKQGKRIKPSPKKDIEMPVELGAFFKENKKAKSAFDKLSAAKQRDYKAYIAEAKQLPTKQKRLEKIKPLILAGLAINELYKKK